MNKPHLNWKEFKAMSNDITPKEDGELIPAWLRARSTGASFGNIDSSDLRPPRLKLLAGQSPEVMDGTPGAIPGHFWITILNQNLGQSVTGTPILLRKSYHIWAPRMPGSDQKGPLATASDGIHWDVPDQVFEVRFPQNPKTYRWMIKKTVFENGLHKFGTSQDDNPKSKPIATLTYDVLWLIDLPEGRRQLCVFTSSRTGVGPTQTFISTTKAMGVDQFYQRYRIVVQRKSGPTGDPYFTYEYNFIGTLKDATECDFTKGLYDQYLKTGFVVDMGDEADDIRTERHVEGGRRDFTQTRAVQEDEDRDSIPF